MNTSDFLKKITALMICAFFTAIFCPLAVNANGTAPPNLTLIIKNAPSDLTVEKGGRAEKPRTSIGGCLVRFRGPDRHDITLLSSKGDKHVILPDEVFQSYDKYAVIDYETLEITSGQPVWRVPAIIAARVLFTLIAEGAVLFILRLVSARNLVIFFITNIITQTFLNLSIMTDNFGSWEMLVLIFDEAMIFIAEAIIYAFLMKNKRGDRMYSVVYALAANAASFFTGLFVLYMLPF